MTGEGQYQEEEYLMISGIQHYAFCKRQWALIHIEQQWEENLRTIDGKILHKNAHDSGFREKRGDVLITRGMQVASSVLGISGECDVVEFHKSENGISIGGLEGTYVVYPVEYKRGKPKENDIDRMQLAAQAMCLEEMLCCNIEKAFLYYGEIRHREIVILDQAIREKTVGLITEMHNVFQKRYTPKAKRTKSCNACSLKNICLPEISQKSASQYIAEMLAEEKLTDEEIA